VVGGLSGQDWRHRAPTGPEADEIIRRARESWGLDDEESDTRQDAVTPVSLDDDGPDLPEYGESDSSDTSDSGSSPLTVARTSWTAAELLAIDFPEPRWAVPGILAEGVSLLVGPPKIGKSWLALDVGLSVATGGKALSRIDVEAGEVLYLALEDTPRRLKNRLLTMLGDDPAPHTLTLATTCPPLPQGGDERIGVWLDQHPGARLVVVDVFARVRGTTPPGTATYDSDYAAVARAKKVADAHGIAMVLVHHVRKAESEDFLDAVSGSHGLAAAADSVLVLKRSRGQADAVLHLTGRDVEEAQHAMKFAAAIGTWELLEGPALDYTLGSTRAAILGYLREHGPARPKQIAEALGIEPGTVRQTCPRMVDDGQLDTDGGGRYFPPVTPVTPVTLAGQGPDEGVTPLSLDVTEEDDE
jgi:DNA-binding MarR family transcriptional regulator